MHREHVFPQWLAKLLFRHLEADPKFSEGTLFRMKMLMEHGERVSQTIDIVTRRVCQACNNTWMSALETRSQPVLAGLLGTGAVLLSPQEQRILSVWAAKTAMTVALARRASDGFVPEAHFRELMATQEPPSGSEVWLAAHRGEYFGCSTHLDKKGITAEVGSTSLGPYVMYSITINIAGLVLQFVGNTVPSHWTLEGASESGTTATRIWPLTGKALTWPPPDVLDDEGLARWAFVRPPSTAQF